VLFSWIIWGTSRRGVSLVMVEDGMRTAIVAQGMLEFWWGVGGLGDA